jgi:hypothetical protein
MNRRGLEFRIAQDEYNLQAARYNLMATYPDGLDDARREVRPSSKTPVLPSAAGARISA